MLAPVKRLAITSTSSTSVDEFLQFHISDQYQDIGMPATRLMIATLPVLVGDLLPSGSSKA